MSQQLVLSLFPGIGLLDMAFEEEGFCVVRGPDLLWGGDVKRFHPPEGKFDGVIGGPPCQFASRFRFLNPHAGRKHGNLIPEFERVVGEAAPDWFLMENVEDAPAPAVAGYEITSRLVGDSWVGGATTRLRRFSFGGAPGVRFHVETMALHAAEPAQAVTGANRLVPVALVRDGNGGHKLKSSLMVHGGHGEPFDRPKMSVEDACELQGLPRDFFGDEVPLTSHGKRKMIGNGVPLPMGRAVARAVKRALGVS